MQIHPDWMIVVYLGGLMIAIGLVLLMRTLLYVSRSQSTTGSVIEVEESDDGDGVSYSPVVRFVDDDGAERTFKDSIQTNPPMFKVGEEVKVYYIPGDSRRPRIGSTFRLVLIPMVLFGIAALMMAIAIWVPPLFDRAVS
jgi:hypothetical protein